MQTAVLWLKNINSWYIFFNSPSISWWSKNVTTLLLPQEDRFSLFPRKNKMNSLHKVLSIHLVPLGSGFSPDSTSFHLIRTVGTVVVTARCLLPYIWWNEYYSSLLHLGLIESLWHCNLNNSHPRQTCVLINRSFIRIQRIK